MADERRTFSQTTPPPTPDLDLDLDRTVLGAGVPSNVDVHRLGEGDNPQADWPQADGPQADWEDGDPSTAATYGSDHANRPRKTEALRGQGRKTLERNRQIVRGQG